MLTFTISLLALQFVTYARAKSKQPRKLKEIYQLSCEITAWDGKGLYPMEMVCTDKDGVKSRWSKTEQHSN